MLHSQIRDSEVARMWRNEHHRAAVNLACDHLETRLNALAARTVGRHLKHPADVLAPERDVDLARHHDPQSEKAEQRGVHQLAMGVLSAVRNPGSHGSTTEPNPALTTAVLQEHLAIYSALHRWLDIADDRLGQPETESDAAAAAPDGAPPSSSD